MDRMQERYHSLDFLRAVAMFLGILLHGMMSFMDTVIPFWAARDDERSPLADLFVFVVHIFRMQTFFLLAGFFGCLLYERYGLRGMIRHRFMRIVIPFVLGVLLVGPTLQAIWFFGEKSALQYIVPGFDTSRPIGENLAELFLTGQFLTKLPLAHLWFLYYLIFLFALMIPCILVGRAFAKTPLGVRMRNGFRRLVALPGKVLILAIPTALLLLPMKFWGFADTPEGWTPSMPVVAYYFFFFTFGWLLWGQRDLLSVFTKCWGYSLLLGNLIVLPAALALFFAAIDGIQGKAELPGIGHQMAVCYLTSLYTWLMIGGLMGAFRYYFNRERKWVRYLADASFWCYLWHLTIIVPMQIALAHVPLPGLIKFALIIGVAMALLLATYEWCVRYTFIGAMLNGRKVRQPRAETFNRDIPPTPVLAQSAESSS
jgi:peptidoglycan/LPS O-acetylase OafA/YrhL